MNDDELDRLVAVSVISDDDVRALDLGSGEAELLEEIMFHHSTTHARRTALLVTAVAAAVIVAVIGIPALTKTDKPAYAERVLAVAEANDRLLPDLPGWSVMRADEFTINSGEMTFGNGSSEVELRWEPSSNYDDLVADRSDPGSTDKVGQITIAGRSGILLRYLNTQNYITISEPASGHVLEIRGDLGSEAAYREFVGSLKPVDVGPWLDAMPASVVKLDDRDTTINEMLVGIPLPPNFNRSGLDDGVSLSDRYQLAAKVTGAVACGWLDQWFTATDAGDAASARAAADAMQTSHDWPILLEMQPQGAWADAVWEWATAINGGPGVGTGAGWAAPTRELAVSGLGCPN